MEKKQDVYTCIPSDCFDCFDGFDGLSTMRCLAAFV